MFSSLSLSDNEIRLFHAAYHAATIPRILFRSAVYPKFLALSRSLAARR